MNLLRRWYGIFMTYKILVVEVPLQYKLSGAFVQNIMSRNQLTLLGLWSLLRTGSLLWLEFSDLRIGPQRKKGLVRLLVSIM